MVQTDDQLKITEEALRTSESHYRSLFENMLNGFAFCRMLFDDNGKPVDFIYLDVNRMFETLTNLKGVVGKKVSEVVPGIQQTNPELFEVYGRVSVTGKPESLETYVPALNIWFLISVYSPQKNHFVAIFENVTARKLAEQQLKDSEKQHRMLFETMVEGVIYQDENGKITAVNPAAQEILGRSESQLLGQTSFCPGETCFHEDMSPFADIDHPMALVINSRKKQSAVMAVHNPKSHKYRWIILSSVPDIAAETGKFNRVYTTFFDFTERKRTEDMLSDQTRDMSDTIAMEEAVISSIADGIITTDEKGFIRLINPVAARLFGIDEKKFTGTPLLALPIVDANGELIPRERRPITIALETRKTVSVPKSNGFFIKRPDGTLVPVSYIETPVLTGDKLIGTIAVYQDGSKQSHGQ